MGNFDDTKPKSVELTLQDSLEEEEVDGENIIR